MLEWNPVAVADQYEVESLAHPSVQYTTPDENIDLLALVPDELYEFRVRAWKPYDGSHLYSLWSDTLRLIAPTPTLWLGHQEDHTVEYAVGSMPTPSPSLPAAADPGVVIPAAIERAVVEWNREVRAAAGKNLKICKSGSCGGSNHDGGVVTIKTVNKNNDSKAHQDANHDQGCGRAVACVKADIPSLLPSDGPGFHLGDISLIIEEPAWECVRVNDITDACGNVRIFWTDILDKDEKPIFGQHHRVLGFFYYIDATMIHEFGHTFGLPDFGKDPSLDGLPAIMDNAHNKTIMNEDIEQLRAIYRVHDSANH